MNRRVSDREILMNTAISITKIFAIVIGLMLLYQAIVPVRYILIAYEKKISLETRGTEILPDLEERVQRLDETVSTLTTKDIEFRLSRIEKSIKVGEVKPDELISLQELRNELKILKKNIFSNPDRVMEFKALQMQYSSLEKRLDKTMEAEDIKREIDFVKNLYYATLAMAGVLIGIFGISWYTGTRRARKIERKDEDVNKKEESGNS